MSKYQPLTPKDMKNAHCADSTLKGLANVKTLYVRDGNAYKTVKRSDVVFKKECWDKSAPDYFDVFAFVGRKRYYLGYVFKNKSKVEKDIHEKLKSTVSNCVEYLINYAKYLVEAKKELADFEATLSK